MPSTLAISAGRAMADGSPTPSSPAFRRDGSPRVPATLSDAELLAEIGRGLTSVYVEFLQQPVPHRTADVLNRIKVAFQT